MSRMRKNPYLDFNNGKLTVKQTLSERARVKLKTLAELNWEDLRKEIHTVEICDGVTSIENSTFSGCTGLTEVAIPASVTSIEAGAFINCSCLTHVRCGGSKEQRRLISEKALRFLPKCDSIITIAHKNVKTEKEKRAWKAIPTETAGPGPSATAS